MTTSFPIIVLAGGLGTRLRAISQNKWPKPMAPVLVQGRHYPFLEFVLAAHKKNGFDDFVICVGHLGQQIVDHFGDGRRFGIRVTYAKAESADTGSRVRQAQAIATAPLHLVVCGDVFFPIDAAAFLDGFAAHPEWMAQLASVNARHTSAEPNVCSDATGLVLAHGDIRGAKGALGVEAGTLAVRADALADFIGAEDFSLTQDLFPALLSQRKLGNIFLDDDFIDIGTPAGYHEFCRYAAAGGAQPLSLLGG